MDETANAKILIIDDDQDTLRLTGIMLERQGYQIVVAANGQQGLEKAEEEYPDLILLDVMMPDMDGFETARRLRQNAATANTPILMFTAKSQLDDKVTGFEAGVDDYLTKPTHTAELEARVRALLARSRADKASMPTAPLRQHCYTIGVLSARGGQGVSSLSINLGATLMTKDNSEVIVAELTPGQGTLALNLDIPDPHELTQILNSEPAEITPQRVEQTLITHKPKLRLLPASYKPAEVSLLNQLEQFEALLHHLVALTHYLILDLGSGLPSFTQKLLPACDECIVLVEGNPNSIIHTKELIEDIASLSVDKNQITAVLNNRSRSETQLSLAQAQKQLGHPTAITLTPAPELFYLATQQHSPVVLAQPESLTSQQYGRLADLVLEHQTQVQ